MLANGKPAMGSRALIVDMANQSDRFCNKIIPSVILNINKPGQSKGIQRRATFNNSYTHLFTSFTSSWSDVVWLLMAHIPYNFGQSNVQYFEPISLKLIVNCIWISFDNKWLVPALFCQLLPTIRYYVAFCDTGFPLYFLNFLNLFKKGCISRGTSLDLTRLTNASNLSLHP